MAHSCRQNEEVKILIDTREQCGFTFKHERYTGTEVEVGTLDTGDYSLVGLTDRVAVERKSLADLVACLGRERYSACQSVLAFTARYRVPFLFAGSRDGAEYATWGLLRQYLEIEGKGFVKKENQLKALELLAKRYRLFDENPAALQPQVVVYMGAKPEEDEHKN
ncbi:MAG: hypothetical protein FWG75_07530 [Cystobacterineae bacterium]|nr:hypothetical protein [Cystobacterineae bacterium]